MPSDMNFIVPHTVEEALEALSVEGSMAVGGGTSVALLIKNRLIEPTQLVYLGHLDGLSGISLSSDGDLVFGSTTTLREIEYSEIVQGQEPVLAYAASEVGNPRVRAAATLGGALAHGDPRQDLPPVFLALDARLHIVGPSGEREVNLDGFFLGLMETTMGEDELIIDVVAPHDPARTTVYSRFAPGSEDDFPTVGVAASVSLQDGIIRNARIALGGVSSFAYLAKDAMALVEGKRPGDVDVDAAAAVAAESTDPSADPRGSAEYKRAMSEVWVRRALERCLSRS